MPSRTASNGSTTRRSSSWNGSPHHAYIPTPTASSTKTKTAMRTTSSIIRSRRTRMTTRSTTHFTHDLLDDPEAIVYRHSDGYPSAAGADILRFFNEVRAQTDDTRFYDSSYLAAKYVVFLAGMFARKRSEE